MIDIIAFDADDTLWHNERLYNRAQDKLAGIGANPESERDVLDLLDHLLDEYNVTFIPLDEIAHFETYRYAAPLRASIPWIMGVWK